MMLEYVHNNLLVDFQIFFIKINNPIMIHWCSCQNSGFQCTGSISLAAIHLSIYLSIYIFTIFPNWAWHTWAPGKKGKGKRKKIKKENKCPFMPLQAALCLKYLMSFFVSWGNHPILGLSATNPVSSFLIIICWIPHWDASILVETSAW